MDNELRNMLVQILEGQEALRLELKKEINEVREDVKKLGNIIDSDISEKLKILSDEQSMIRKEVSEINQGDWRIASFGPAAFRKGPRGVVNKN